MRVSFIGLLLAAFFTGRCLAQTNPPAPNLGQALSQGLAEAMREAQAKEAAAKEAAAQEAAAAKAAAANQPKATVAPAPAAPQTTTIPLTPGIDPTMPSRSSRRAPYYRGSSYYYPTRPTVEQPLRRLGEAPKDSNYRRLGEAPNATPAPAPVPFGTPTPSVPSRTIEPPAHSADYTPQPRQHSLSRIVEAVDTATGTLTVKNKTTLESRTFKVSPTTRYTVPGRSDGSLADIRPGDKVYVYYTDDGQVVRVVATHP